MLLLARNHPEAPGFTWRDGPGTETSGPLLGVQGAHFGAGEGRIRPCCATSALGRTGPCHRLAVRQTPRICKQRGSLVWDLPSSLGAGIKDGAWPHEPAVQEQQLGQDHPLSEALRYRERL